MQCKEVINFSLRDIFQVLFKRKLQILLFFFGTICIVTIGVLFVKPTYKAEAQFLVKLGRESIYVPEIGKPNAFISVNRKNQINSEVEILKSSSLIKEVVNDIGPSIIYDELAQNNKSFIASFLDLVRKPGSQSEAALLEAQRNLEIRAIEDSGIIEVSFKHTDPQMAANVLSKLAQHYLELHLRVYKSAHFPAFFRQQAQHLKEKLGENEIRLQTLKANYNVTSFEEQQRLILVKIDQLRSELDRTHSQIVEVQSRIELQRQKLAETPETISQGEYVDRNTLLINNLEARLMELKLQKKQLLTKYTDKNHLIKSIDEEIDIISENLAQQEDKRYGTTHWGINVTFQNLQQQLNSSEADLKSLEAKSKIQSIQLQEYRKELEYLNSIEIEYEQLRQAVEVDRQNYRLYLTKFEESRISEAMDSEKISNVTLIEPVQVPVEPVSPKKFLVLVLGLFLATAVSIGLTFLFHYMDDRLETVESVENCLEVPVLISIPYIKKREL